MPLETPRRLLEVNYYQAAQDYLRRLPPEHFMEATPQATQREITLESFALIQAQRPDVHRFNKLLVQYPLANSRGKRKIGQVVPDNMVVVYDGPIKAEGSYDIPLQPVGPLLVLEYVSKSSKRKDYDDSMYKYEHALKVPYYLLFYPEVQELTLYKHTGEKYVSTHPDAHGRHAIAELELEAAVQDGWVRYWFRGKLLPLPGELLDEINNKNAQLREKNEQLQEKNEQLQEERQRVAAMAAELEQLRRQLNQR